MASMYSDFGFYSEEYHGTLSKSEYSARVMRAYSEINVRTMGRKITDMEEALKLCECEIVDALFAFSQNPTGVASVNNDGYAIHFNDEFSEAKQIQAICERYLTQPVNLMSRWA